MIITWEMLAVPETNNKCGPTYLQTKRDTKKHIRIHFGTKSVSPTFASLPKWIMNESTEKSLECDIPNGKSKYHPLLLNGSNAMQLMNLNYCRNRYFKLGPQLMLSVVIKFSENAIIDVNVDQVILMNKLEYSKSISISN